MTVTDPRDELIAGSVKNILNCLGYDLDDPHFSRTPERVTQVLAGFRRNGDPQAVKALLDVQFLEERTIDTLVLEGPISYTSMCAHHMLPVEGVAFVGYLPNLRICGLSKLARVTDHFARQFTVQERVTSDIADALMQHLQPNGVMVVIQAKHGCMTLRGVRELYCETATSTVRGVFKESSAARNEFLNLMTLRSRALCS